MVANPMPNVVTPPPLAKVAKASKASKKKKETQGNQGQLDLKDTVRRLTAQRVSGYEDLDFAERALLYLMRKMSTSFPESAASFESAVAAAASSGPCVRLPRPRDGRMTVAKSSVASTKKVFPQVTLCQIFRWPHIVFHNDIRSVEGCGFRAAVKPSPEAVAAAWPRRAAIRA